MTSNISLDALQLAIERVAARIVNLEKELAAAEPSRVSYLQDTVLELRREKNELRKQETILLQANVPGQCDCTVLLVCTILYSRD